MLCKFIGYDLAKPTSLAFVFHKHDNTQLVTKTS